MPNRFDLNAPRKRRRGLAPKPRRNRARNEPKSTLLYWIVGALTVVLILAFVIGADLPRLKTYVAQWRASTFGREENQEAGQASSPLSDRAQNDQLMRHLQEKLDAEKKHEAAVRAKAELAAQKKAAVLAQQAASAERSKENPTLTGVPTFPAPKAGVPARALPLDPNVLTTERVAAYQVALERMHFSCGFIDGDQGMRTQRMLRAFQQSRDLPMTGVLDAGTRAAIGEPGEPFLNYTVTQADLDSIMPKPQTWREKAKATRLGYNDIWELLTEKFHCTRGYLKQLNRDVPQPVAGSDIIGPKVYPAAPYPMAASLRVNLGETSIEALDASGRVIAFFPCSIAKDKNKRPNGRLVVKSVVPNPDYTFDPALFKDASVEEHITHKMTLPPGPRNPVGTAWIGLSLPGYGIHGTPEPENISRTQSHGCFRLANWNANKVLRMVRVGTPVDVEP
jgi:lipoprotein-anchoring transpeptidase ErfK/SrfK